MFHETFAGNLVLNSSNLGQFFLLIDLIWVTTDMCLSVVIILESII